MRYVILGAGAIGAAIGGRLAESGHEVLLVGRGAHAAAVRRDGLRLVMPDRAAQLPVPMVTTAELALARTDVLLVAVKTQDTAALLDQVSRAQTDGTAVSSLPLLCVQNGVANEDMALRFFERVYGVCVSMPATHLQPGVVEAPGTPISGVLHIGRYPAGSDDLAEAVASDLERSGFRAPVRPDVMEWKRAKLAANLVNALHVLCADGMDRTAMAGQTGVGAVRAKLAAEATACFAAANWQVTEEGEFRAGSGGFQIAPIEGSTRKGSSTWQSVQRGLPSVETDFLNGEIVRLGRLHGVPTPANAAVQAAMREVLSGSLAPGTVDPAALLAAG